MNYKESVQHTDHISASRFYHVNWSDDGVAKMYLETRQSALRLCIPYRVTYYINFTSIYKELTIVTTIHSTALVRDRSRNTLGCAHRSLNIVAALLAMRSSTRCQRGLGTLKNVAFHVAKSKDFVKLLSAHFLSLVLHSLLD